MCGCVSRCLAVPLTLVVVGPVGALGGRLEDQGDVMVGSQFIGAMSSRRPDSSRFRGGWAGLRFWLLAGPSLGLFSAFLPMDPIK